MNDLREGFEQWLNSKFICTDGGTNEWTKQFEYAYPHVQSMWVAWQASRQHDNHAEFVRKVLDIIEDGAFSDLAALCEIEVICDAELAKEQP